MERTSLYRCPGSCGKVMRGESGHAYGCMCDALPLGTDGGKFDPPYGMTTWGGQGQIGPPRPYYHDREHRMIETPDDGRDGVEDLRAALWLA